ncbi:MAG TPA: glycosyltransferase family 4 protein [Flavobacterium sp.]|uniref:glycosyltransferase family 4 protein n=1 Tax=Flavobacterium sp. TaxID=239 RepID=UPI002DB91B5A|nr:glycosyltransferase family 4 protein [Flavobacterium sp.]HEU4788939.1 glycosyltransferase family 4 protein [Flavobacterium sp.]
MRKIIYVAPFVKNRYKGGIMRIAEYLKEEETIVQFESNRIEMEFFNSAVLSQKKNSEGKLSIENIKQALYLLYSLSKRVFNKDFDAVHFNSSAKAPLLKDQLIFFLISRLASKKYIFQIHFSGVNETFLSFGFLRSLQFWFLKRVDTIVLLSDSFKNELVASGIPESKITVLYNFHTLKNNLKINTLSSGRELQLLFVGSINQRKGFNDLLEALKVLNIDYSLNVLGDFSSDEMKEFCDNFIEENRLKVNFHGYLAGQNKFDVISKSDILILPSYAEGFPMVIPEAMALGCAIISTNIAGIPEIVQNGYNGYLISPGEIDELAEKIMYLDNNREELKVFRENSLNLSSKFNLENYIEKICTIYNN